MVTQEASIDYQSKINDVDEKLSKQKDLRTKLLKDKSVKEKKFEKLEKKLTQLSRVSAVKNGSHE